MDADVAVVGAGPAGAVAAFVLAARGTRVLVLDGSHPREKPCGGGVTRRALDELATAGVTDVPMDPATVVEEAVFEDHSGRAVTVPLGKRSGTLAVTSRRRLDSALLDAACEAGARFTRARVTDIRVTRTAAEVQTASQRYRVGLVIGADGATSLVRRRVWRRFRRSQLSIATGFFAQGLSSRQIRVRFAAHPPGYLWSFPRPDHLAIGICASAATSQAPVLRKTVNDWIAVRRLADGAALVPYSWPIPTLSPRDLTEQQIAGRRWLLVGDAAGLVDPLTREGIYFALRSARCAAEAVLAQGDAAARFQAQLADEIYPELRHAARLTTGFFHPAFLRVLIDSLDRSDAIRSLMVDLIAGQQPYTTIVQRLLATFEFSLAWRFVRLRLSAHGPRSVGTA